jgi:hypothetical protein
LIGPGTSNLDFSVFNRYAGRGRGTADFDHDYGAGNPVCVEDYLVSLSERGVPEANRGAGQERSSKKQREIEVLLTPSDERRRLPNL